MVPDQKKKCGTFPCLLLCLCVSPWHPAPSLRSPPLHSLLTPFTQLFAFSRIAPPPRSPRGCKSCGRLSPDWLAGLPLNVRSAHISLTARLRLSASPSARTGLLFKISDVQKKKKKGREGQGASRLDSHDFNPSVAKTLSPPPPPPTCDVKRIM